MCSEIHNRWNINLRVQVWVHIYQWAEWTRMKNATYGTREEIEGSQIGSTHQSCSLDVTFIPSPDQSTGSAGVMTTN